MLACELVQKQQTALMEVLSSFKEEQAVAAARVLCAFGPNLSVVNKKGQSPLVICGEKWMKFPALCSAVANANTPKTIDPAKLNQPDKKGYTMFYRYDAAGHNSSLLIHFRLHASSITSLVLADRMATPLRVWLEICCAG